MSSSLRCRAVAHSPWLYFLLAAFICTLVASPAAANSPVLKKQQRSQLLPRRISYPGGREFLQRVYARTRFFDLRIIGDHALEVELTDVVDGLRLTTSGRQTLQRRTRAILQSAALRSFDSLRSNSGVNRIWYAHLGSNGPSFQLFVPRVLLEHPEQLQAHTHGETWSSGLFPTVAHLEQMIAHDLPALELTTTHDWSYSDALSVVLGSHSFLNWLPGMPVGAEEEAALSLVAKIMGRENELSGETLMRTLYGVDGPKLPSFLKEMHLSQISNYLGHLFDLGPLNQPTPR